MWKTYQSKLNKDQQVLSSNIDLYKQKMQWENSHNKEKHIWFDPGRRHKPCLVLPSLRACGIKTTMPNQRCGVTHCGDPPWMMEQLKVALSIPFNLLVVKVFLKIWWWKWQKVPLNFLSTPFQPDLTSPVDVSESRDLHTTSTAGTDCWL